MFATSVMKKHKQLTYIFFIILFLLTSCSGTYHKKAKGISIEDKFITELKENQIGRSDYYISIPANYSIKETIGPDFSVYYFFPKDTNIKATFSGGLYFGNHPNKFEPDNDFD